MVMGKKKRIEGKDGECTGHAKLAESRVGEAAVVAGQARPNYDVGKAAVAVSYHGPKSKVNIHGMGEKWGQGLGKRS